jgi:hypothetical protein
MVVPEQDDPVPPATGRRSVQLLTKVIESPERTPLWDRVSGARESRHVPNRDDQCPDMSGASTMHENSAGSAAFWASVTHDVTARVEPVLNRNTQARADVIAYLRDLEAVALREGSSREALQVIASGRRLLGDRSEAARAAVARAVRASLA